MFWSRRGSFMSDKIEMNKLNKGEQLIPPDHTGLVYSGRIDFSDLTAPCFIYAGSQVHFRFRGSRLGILLRNHPLYYDNYIGYVLDHTLQGKLKLPSSGCEVTVSIPEQLDDAEHEVILFKRQDAAHYFDLLGFLLEPSARMLKAPSRPKRRMECYGDSVSAGELSEAVTYVGRPDPVHNGEYSNSWYSYAAITARRLGAELHNNSQGGLALLDYTGYFHGPDYVGLERTYDKLRYNTQLGSYSSWDFKRYLPHVVIVAIGQNDSHPEDYMGHDLQKSAYWRVHYKALLIKFRERYPKALIILATTILNHSAAWDAAIGQAAAELNDPRIIHYLYTNNGCGTPGHIRIPEAEQMAKELTARIEAFGEDIWLPQPY